MIVANKLSFYLKKSVRTFIILLAEETP